MVANSEQVDMLLVAKQLARMTVGLGWREFVRKVLLRWN